MDVKEMANDELIFVARTIISTGGFVDAQEKRMLTELIDRFEDMCEREYGEKR